MNFNKTASGGFSFMNPDGELHDFSKKPPPAAFPLCFPKENNINVQKSASGVLTLCSPQENNIQCKFSRIRRILLCLPLREMTRTAKSSRAMLQASPLGQILRDNALGLGVNPNLKGERFRIWGLGLNLLYYLGRCY